jgi:transcriptional regulator with XRE-family HTH domain
MSEQTASPVGVPQWDTSDRMRKALRHAGIGVQEMADYLDVSRNTVSTWINGRISPSTQTLRLWAMRCGVSFSWLANGDTTGPINGGAELFDQFRRGTSRRSLAPLIYAHFIREPPITLTRELAA